MSDNAKEKVLAVYPGAWFWPRTESIFDVNGHSISDCCDSEAEAWADAASRLPGYKLPMVETPFGTMAHLDAQEQTMIVCTNNGTGWKPRRFLLTHQLYTQNIDKWLEEDPRIFEVACFSVNPDAYVTVWSSSKDTRKHLAKEAGCCMPTATTLEVIPTRG